MLRLALALGLAQVAFHAWIAALPVAMAAVGRVDSVIGVVVGSAAVFNMLAALGVGGFIDRFGGRRMYLVGCAFLAAGAAPVALGAVDPASPLPLLVGLRMVQGVGIALVLPAIFTLVPTQVSPARVPTAIGVVGVAGNVSLALSPAIALLFFDRFGLGAVGTAACLSLAVGSAAIWPVRDVGRSPGTNALAGAASRRLRPAWRPTWLAPLVASGLFVAHWGVVTAYLPQRAELVGADIGLFFAADAIGLLALRVPAAWVAGRVGSRPVVLAGVVISLLGLVLLLLTPTTSLLIVSGALTGAGSAFFFPVIVLELTLRSDGRDRGSAMALFTVAFSAGIALGSLGIAPVYSFVGFERALVGGLALLAGSGLLVARDRSFARPPDGRPLLDAASETGMLPGPAPVWPAEPSGASRISPEEGRP